jgi:hypothetical protein
MTTLCWQQLYEAALLELRPEELQLAIETAEAALHQRLRELQESADESDGGEQHAIVDALRSLRTLAKTECKPLSCFPADASIIGEVAS